MQTMILAKENVFNSIAMMGPLFMNPSRVDYDIMYDIENTDPIIFNQAITACAVYIGNNNSQTMYFDTVSIKGFSSTNLSRLILRHGSPATTLVLIGGNTTMADWWPNIPSGNFCVKCEPITSDTFTLECRFYNTYTSTNAISFNYIFLGFNALTKNPKYNDYVPIIKSKQFVHENSGGGTVKYKLTDNFRATLNYGFIEDTDDIKDLYDYNDTMSFIPNPTMSSWNGNVYIVNWVNGWEFYNYSDNYKFSGYSGTIELAE